MQIVFHIGANQTDEERLLKSLLKNGDVFSQQGIKVPGPGKYRRLLRETIKNLQGATPSKDTRDILIDAILDDEQANRLVMSHVSFFGVAQWIFDGGEFYGLAERKLTGLRALFPDDELELHFAIRNPATFLPAIMKEAKSNDINDFMRGVDPMSLRWSNLITRIKTCLPDVPLTVWCNEDTPMIWAQLIREMSGVDPLTKIVGGFDLLSAIMSEDGMKRLLTYLKSHPPQTEVQKRRIVAAFLDKFALDDQIEEELDVPGWTDHTVALLSDQYEQDIDLIARMSGVNFIAP